MKKLALALALFALCSVTFAQVTPAPVPLPDNELLLQAAVTRPQGQPTAVNAGVAWLHNSGAITDGIVTEIFRHGDAGGAGLGPLLEARIADVGAGSVFIGGDVLVLLSTASNNSAGAARGRLGYRHPLAKDGHAALRITGEYWTPVALKAGGQPSDVKQVAVLFGISLGAKAPGTPTARMRQAAPSSEPEAEACTGS